MAKPWFDDFDPNGPIKFDNYFGLPCSLEDAEAIIIPVPWEATVSYGAGTAMGPSIIEQASHQVDLYQEDIFYAWKLGIAKSPIEQKVWLLKEDIDKKTSAAKTGEVYEPTKARLKEVNSASTVLNKFMEEHCSEFLAKEKVIGVVGGEHSVPLGFIQALGKKYADFGVLQIDAHADLRNAYEGYTNSHASIMHNMLEVKQVTKLVQVGVRDFCDEEAERMSEDDRIESFTSTQMSENLFNGMTWQEQVKKIITHLPEHVYISFDIDGLDPSLCPGTGTPVPGGLSFEQVNYLIGTLARSDRTIIGFDLSEVSPGTGDGVWDGNVGARVLYRLINLTAASQNKILFH